MRGRSVRLLGLLLVALLGLLALRSGRAAHAAAPNVADNGLTNGVLSGPTTLTVGQPATFTFVVDVDPGLGAVGDGSLPDLTIAVPGGTATITINDSNTIFPCPPQMFAAGPVTYQACGGYIVGGGFPAVTLTITLTPTVATPALTLGATLCFAGGCASATFSSVVQAPVVPSTVTLAMTPTTPAPGTVATLTATVSCPGVTPTGTVTFSNGGTVLGTVPVSGGVAILPITVPPVGALGVVATYNGDPACSPGSSSGLLVQGTVPANVPAVLLQTIGVQGCGSVTPNNVPALALQNISYTAVPCPGSVFSGWSGGPCDKTRINPCSIPTGLVVTAVFTP